MPNTHTPTCQILIESADSSSTIRAHLKRDEEIRMHSVTSLVGPSASTLVLLIGSGLVAPVPASAVDPVEVGAVIQVSDGTETYAYDPRISADPAGNFLVAWQDADTNEVNGRAFWSTGIARGPVFQISNPNDDIFASPGEFDTDGLVDLAADRAGNFVVAYNARNHGETGPCAFPKNCIWTKRLDADGNLAPADFIVGDPRLFSYGSLSYNQTANPEIAADGRGNFIVAWEGYDADSEGVWARKLVGSGQVNGAQFRVNEHTDEYQGDGGQLDVAADEDGNFVVVWQDDNLVSPPYGGIVFGRFDKAKNPLGQQTQAASDGYDPHVAQLPDGTFMLAWFGSVVETAGRVFDPNGVPVGTPFEVTSYGRYPEIAASAAGAFIVAFETENGIGVRVFDATGAATSSEIALDAGSYSYTPHVSAAANGDFVVVWNEGYDGVFAQRFQATPPPPRTDPRPRQGGRPLQQDPRGLREEPRQVEGQWLRNRGSPARLRERPSLQRRSRRNRQGLRPLRLRHFRPRRDRRPPLPELDRHRRKQGHLGPQARLQVHRWKAPGRPLQLRQHHRHQEDLRQLQRHVDGLQKPEKSGPGELRASGRASFGPFG